MGPGDGFPGPIHVKIHQRNRLHPEPPTGLDVLSVVEWDHGDPTGILSSLL